MLPQLLFFMLLHATGTAFALLLRKRTTVLFAGLSGFLWGLLFWVVLGLGFICAGVPYNRSTMLVAMGLLVGVLIVWNHRQTSLSWDEAKLLVLIFLLASLSLLVLLRCNLTVVSYDSLTQLNAGRACAEDGQLSRMVRRELASWGPFMLIAHSSAVFLELDYAWGLHPYMLIVLAVLFCYLSYRGTGVVVASTVVRIVLVALSLLLLATTYFVLFQGFYIHNNMPAAIYLFVCLATMWLGLVERNHTWLVFSMLSLLAFSLLRAEGVVFAVLFLLPLVATNRISFRAKLAYITPYVVHMVVWQLFLLCAVEYDSEILSPERVAVCLLALVGVEVLLLFSHAGHRTLRRLAVASPWLAFCTLGAVLFLVSYVQPAHMGACFAAFGKNMSSSGNWAGFWIVAVTAFCLVFWTKRLDCEAVFLPTIPAFFVLLLALGFFRLPFREGWGDSGNRILTHIAPVALFYIAAKIAALWNDREMAGSDTILLRRRGAVALGSGFLLFLIVMIFRSTLAA